MSNKSPHISVLLKESVDALNIKPSGIYVDGTLGAGGHAIEILQCLQDGTLLGFDLDPDALEISKVRLSQFVPAIQLFNKSYTELREVLDQLEIESVDGVLLDLGYSSMQIEDATRGFSFQQEGPLDMRFSPDHWNTAADIINDAPLQELIRIFKQYGEERWSAQIAKAIVERRVESPFETTTQLAQIVKEAVPKRAQYAKKKSKYTHPATRIFQALRIAVNNELEEVRSGISIAFECLGPGGRLAVITFHSLEDRIVKQYMKSLADGCTCPPDLPICGCGFVPLAKVHKDIAPSQQEVEQNPRARSARLRILEKL